MSKYVVSTFIFVAAIGTSPMSSAAREPSFRGLGHLVEQTIYGAGQALSVSADGSVIVGISGTATGFGAYRWTEGSGMMYLGDLPGGAEYSIANGVSADGATIVGRSLASGRESAFRWTEPEGMVALAAPLLGGSPAGSTAQDVSADGRVIVGFAERNGFSPRAVRWVDGVPTLLAPELPYSQAYSVSDDGNVIVGRATFPSGDTLAFRWTEETGIESLGDLPGGDNSSFAFAVCGNGGAIVGVGHAGNSRQFRWTETSGMHDLGPYVGRALGCSVDGNVVVGEMNTPAGLRPIIWDEAHGLRDIQDILLGYGISASLDWRNMTARAASADGTVVVGEGRRGDGRLESWVAVLVPEPPAYTYASLAAAMLAMIRYRTGRRCRSA